MAQRSKRWLAALACVTAATAQARTLPEMAASNGFVICAAPDDMPFSRRDGTPAGLYVDLGRLVASDLGLPLGVRWIPRRELARRVGCDAIMGTAVVKAADPDHITSWRNVPTIPWMRAGAVVVDAGRAPVATLDALRTGHVAVPSGSWAHRWLDAHGVPVWVRFRTDPEIIDAVVRGDADAGVVSDLAAGWYRQQAGAANLRVLDTLLDPDEFGFDVAIDLLDTDAATLARVNAIVRARLADGAIAAIGMRYGAYRPPAGQH
jgi:polar amino acid transport system substrate-binding protein